MTSPIARQRLHNLQIAGGACATPAELVGRLGAVQAQDYPGAVWALGLRLPRATVATVEEAFAAGAILRTHVLRPTWHVVTAEDVRWLLELTAPRVRATLAHYDRQLELAAALQQAGIDTGNGQRMEHLLMRAELDAVICSGARRGKQQTYALLAERAPQAKRLAREEALAELVLRYFGSHGPATLKDFAWWSGLTGADARTGLDLVGQRLVCGQFEGQRYWAGAATARVEAGVSPAAYLLPNYDEYTVGYADRAAVFDASHTSTLGSRENILFHHTVVLDGRIAGTWKRVERKGTVAVTPTYFAPPSERERQAVAAAAERYGRFLGLPAVLA